MTSSTRHAIALLSHIDARRQPRRERDLRVLGARGLDSAALVRLVCGRVADDDVAEAVTALGLEPRARDAVLLRSPLGPRLLAAMELGRRAWLLPSPAATRITGPADVMAALAPRLVDDHSIWVIAIDVRLRVAGARPIDDGADVDDLVAGVLQQTLAVGCRRVVLVSRRPGPAIIDVDDAARLRLLRERGALVGVVVLDHVVCGDDGWASLLRLGVVEGSGDPRYR